MIKIWKYWSVLGIYILLGVLSKKDGTYIGRLLVGLFQLVVDFSQLLLSFVQILIELRDSLHQAGVLLFGLFGYLRIYDYSIENRKREKYIDKKQSYKLELLLEILGLLLGLIGSIHSILLLELHSLHFLFNWVHSWGRHLYCCFWLELEIEKRM